MAKKKFNKYIATATAAAVLVAPMAVTPAEAANTTATTVTSAINALANAAAANQSFYDAVSAARTDYDNLLTAQKKLVTSATVTKLVNAEGAAAIMQKITALEALDFTDSTVPTKISEIRTLYAKLTVAGKVLVKNYSTLTNIETQVAAAQVDVTAAAKVTNQIKSLGGTPTAATVNAARTAYDNLTDPQKDLVEDATVELLEAKEAYIASVTAATGKVATYVGKVAAIAAASDRSVALSDAAAVYLSDAEIALLTSDKKTELANAKKTYDNYFAAQAVITKIADLTLAGDFSAYANAVKEARSGYATLTVAQKALVTNYTTLQGHEQRVAAEANPHAAAVAEVEGLITNLPTVEAATVSDVTAITNASLKYNALASEAKALVNSTLVNKLNSLLSLPIFPNTATVDEFEAEVASVKSRPATTVALAIQALENKYATLPVGVKAVIDANGNYAKVLLAKPVVEAIDTAVAGVPVGSELTVENSALTALVTAESGYNTLAGDVKEYVRNISSLTSKLNATKSVLKNNVTAEIANIPTVNSTTVSVLAAKITAADAALAKYAVILGVANYASATEAIKTSVTSTIATYSDLKLAKDALPVVEAVAALNYIHPTGGTVDTDALSGAITAYKTALVKVTAIGDNKYFVNKSKFESLDKTAIERSIAALATAADAEITKIANISDKTLGGLTTAISNAETAVGKYTTAQTAYTGVTATTTAITKYADIALAKLAKPVVEKIDNLPEYTGDVTAKGTAITKNADARAAYTNLAANVKPFVINIEKLTENERKANNDLTGLKSAANLAISNLTASAAELTTKISDATTAVADYKAIYDLLNPGTAAATVYATLINHGDIAVATEAAKSGGLLALVDDLAATLPTDATQLATEIGKYKAVKGLVNALPANYKFFLNKEKYDDFEDLLDAKLDGLKTDANTAIGNLTTAANATDLGTAVTNATNAANAYISLYTDIKDVTAEQAQSNLTNYLNIAKANTALTGIVAQVETATATPYTHADPVVPGDLDAAITTYKALKTKVDSLNGDYAFFVNKTKYDSLETAVKTSVNDLKAKANAEIAKLTTPTPADAAALGTALTNAKTAVGLYLPRYATLNNVTEAQAAAQLTNYANVAYAGVAQPILVKVEALSYTHASPVDINTLMPALIAYDAAKFFITDEFVSNPFYVSHGGKFATVKAQLELSMAALETAAIDAIDDIEGAMNSGELLTKITEASTATNHYLEAYVIFNSDASKTDAQIRTEGKATITNYANIEAAENAMPVVQKIEALTYTHPTTGTVNMTTLGTAITKYHEAVTSLGELEPEEQDLVINKDDLKVHPTDSTQDGKVVEELKASIAALAAVANTNITMMKTPAPTNATGLNSLVEAAETAVLNYETADKAFTKAATADLTKITNYTHIASAKEALSVAVTIEVALGAMDLASTPTEHERLVKLLAAKTALEGLNATADLYVFNKGLLTSAIAELDEFDNRVVLLSTANQKVADLQANTVAANVSSLITAANNAVDAYVAKTIVETAAPLATDVVGYADIALYEAALQTISKIIAIAGLTDKAQAVADARALYTPLAENVKAKVINYADLTAAEQLVVEQKAEANSNAKEAAEEAITAIKSKTTVSDFKGQINTAQNKVTAYKNLSATNSIIDIANIDDLEYAKEAVSTIEAIDALDETSTPEEIQEAKNLYNALSAQAKAFVFNAEDLSVLADDTEILNNVLSLVTAVTTATPADLATKLQAAKDAYNALTLEQKAELADKKILEKLNNYTAAEPVVTKVHALHTASAGWTAANLTTADITVIEGQISTARTDYARLVVAQKVLVTNYSNLTAIEEKLKQVKSDQAKAADQQIAGVVIDKIAALDSMTVGTPEYVAAVKAARAAYAALTVKYKALVTNLTDLVRHERNL
jgi:hypothetical protein